MVAITATNAATPSLQSLLSKARLQQARTEADQAESKAQSLRAQADAAELDAQSSREKVRTLTARENSLKLNPDARPVLNPQGQSTGRLVNLLA